MLFNNQITGSRSNEDDLYRRYQTFSAAEALKIIEDNGIPFSRKALEVAKEEISLNLLSLEAQLYDFEEIHTFEKLEGVKFNVNSPKQVCIVLFDMLGLPPSKKTATGNWSTDEEVLTELAKEHSLPELILKIKKDKKIKSTYVDKVLIHLDSDNRLRTNFNQHVTTSGRLSSSGTLNAQQLPRDDKRVKKAITARPGYKIVSQDLKTAEMYIAAVMSEDATMQNIFHDKVDFHGKIAKMENSLPCEVSEVAKFYPKERQEAKTFGFKVLYQLFLEHPVLSEFPTLKKYLKAKGAFIEQNGYVYSEFGRKRRVPNVFSNNSDTAAHHVRSAVNFLFQSVASDINLLATIDMVNFIKGTKMDAKIFMLVHDSIVAEVKEEELKLYCRKLKYFTQKDRGVSIENCPIGVDLEIGDNYAFV